MTDPIVEEVRRVREELIRQYGGLDGYLKHCQEQDRQRTRAATVQAERNQRRRRLAALRKGRPNS